MIGTSKRLFMVSLSLVISSVGCMTVRSISVNQVPKQSERRNKISSSDSGFIVFLIPFGNSFVTTAKEHLMDQCPGGAIEGLLTKFQSTTYVPLVLEMPQVTMEGYCVKAPKKGRA